MSSFTVLVVAAVFAGAMSQAVRQEPQYAPIPYQFAYRAESDEGAHGHSETSDGNGNAQGEYFIKLTDGRARNVRYTADGNGFVVEIETNELGTESKDSADAKYTSSAITGTEAALQYGAASTSTQRQSVVAAPSPRVVTVSAPTRTVVRTVHSAPVIKTVTAHHPITVVKTSSSPTIVKTIRTSPARFTVSHGSHDVHHVIH